MPEAKKTKKPKGVIQKPKAKAKAKPKATTQKEFEGAAFNINELDVVAGRVECVHGSQTMVGNGKARKLTVIGACALRAENAEELFDVVDKIKVEIRAVVPEGIKHRPPEHPVRGTLKDYTPTSSGHRIKVKVLVENPTAREAAECAWMSMHETGRFVLINTGEALAEVKPGAKG